MIYILLILIFLILIFNLDRKKLFFNYNKDS
jgi:hypothetical protein